MSQYFRIVVGSSEAGGGVFFRQLVRGGFTSDPATFTGDAPAWSVDSREPGLGRYGFDRSGREISGLTGVEFQGIYGAPAAWVRWMSDSPAVRDAGLPAAGQYYRSEFLTMGIRPDSSVIDVVQWSYAVDSSGNVTPYGPVPRP